MGHRSTAIFMASMLALVCALGLAFGALIQLEIGGGPGTELISMTAYNQAFAAHGAAMSLALRAFMFGAIANGYVAVLLERAGVRSGASRWVTSAGSVAYLSAILGLLRLWVREPGAVETVEWMVGLSWTSLALGDALMGLGVLLGMRAAAWRRSSDAILAWAVVIAASLQLLTGVLGMLAGLQGQVVVAGGLAVPTLLTLGLALSAQSGAQRQAARGLAVAGLLAVGVHAIASSFIYLPGLLAQLLALVALVAGARGSGQRSRAPAADCAAPVIIVYALSFVVRAYMATLSVDVHLWDSYFVVGEFHLCALLTLGLGGSMALRYFGPERFEGAPAWRRALGPWVLGGAILGFSIAELGLGHEGMPRRYYAYLPEYILGHRVATVAAALIGAALIGELLSWWQGRAKVPGEALS